MEKAQSEVRHVLHGKGKVGTQSEIHQFNYLSLVIKETLRLHPPGPLLPPRQSRERCEIDGYEIAKGTKVFVNAWALARDPEYWNDADTFKPERFQDLSVDYKGNFFEYIPFGAGKRICPGMSFGVANIEVPLAQLLYHFNWKLPNGANPEELDMTELFGATARRKSNLCLIPTPY
ncbi:Cytochrome p450 [Thalictrum thalictroides]|uniref:Cytochrome p450 n=1 Tax=Thalictrum thalictroides TaxID=46969 RepID=A0A7J6WUK1_THATH|nr:Cytochrome p450 [Thalictrum thalictroides]